MEIEDNIKQSQIALKVLIWSIYNKKFDIISAQESKKLL